MEMIRYCLIAEPMFHFRCGSYLIEEEDVENTDSLQLWLNGNDLLDYHLMKSSLYTLIAEGKIYINRKYLNVIVDFDQLEQNRLKSFNS